MPKIKNWSVDRYTKNREDKWKWNHDNTESFIAIQKYGENKWKYYYGPDHDNQDYMDFENKKDAMETARNMMRNNPKGLGKDEKISRSSRPSKPRGKTPERLKGRRSRD